MLVLFAVVLLSIAFVGRVRKPKNKRHRLGIIERVRNLWWARQRKIDLEVLWPACKEHTRNIAAARAAFAMHAFSDTCWIGYYGKQELMEVIGALK